MEKSGKLGSCLQLEKWESEGGLLKTATSGCEQLKRGLNVGGKMRVAVFGDAMLDVYHIGEASRLSAEVPIPIVKIVDEKRFSGGAANVAMGLFRLDVDVAMCYNNPIALKHRLMVGDHQLARWDEHDEASPWKGVLTGKIDAIVVSDYGKGAVDSDLPARLKNYEVPIFVDTKRDPKMWEGVATAVFPNAKEATEFGSYYGFDGLVCQKLGDKGLCLYKDTNLVASSHAQARFVKSVNGAGDTVLAAFVYQYLRQREPGSVIDWKFNLEFANCAAAIAVEHPYTYAPTLDEVITRLYE